MLKTGGFKIKVFIMLRAGGFKMVFKISLCALATKHFKDELIVLIEHPVHFVHGCGWMYN